MSVKDKEEAAFLAGFAGVNGQEESAAHEAEEELKKPEQEQTAEPEATEGQENEQAETQAEEVPKIAGFTEEELRNLLSRAAKVDELEAGLRKAHGKIGELNGSLQELRTKAPAKQPEPTVDVAHVEEDYPDIAAWVRAQMGQKESVEQEQKPAQVEQPAQTDKAIELQLALMDHMHEGWQDKVQSRDFNLWLAAQTDDYRTKYQTASTAKELSSVLTQFDAWSTGRSQRNTTGQKRLEQAMTPQGSAGKPKTAPTAEEAFLAGFKSVANR